jgi:hypothetical protein
VHLIYADSALLLRRDVVTGQEDTIAIINLPPIGVSEKEVSSGGGRTTVERNVAPSCTGGR